jgi:hypothetical protein
VHAAARATSAPSDQTRLRSGNLARNNAPSPLPHRRLFQPHSRGVAQGELTCRSDRNINPAFTTILKQYAEAVLFTIFIHHQAVAHRQCSVSVSVAFRWCHSPVTRRSRSELQSAFEPSKISTRVPVMRCPLRTRRIPTYHL